MGNVRPRFKESGPPSPFDARRQRSHSLFAMWVTLPLATGLSVAEPMYDSEAKCGRRGRDGVTLAAEPVVVLDGQITEMSLADVGGLDVESIEIVCWQDAKRRYGLELPANVIDIRTKKHPSRSDDIRPA